MAEIDDDVTPIANAQEEVGTIELRVSALRRFGDSHALADTVPYYNVDEEGVSDQKVAGYKVVEPQFQITYDKTALAFKGSKLKVRQNNMNAMRPGKEDWAVFRFHYRRECEYDLLQNQPSN